MPRRSVFALALAAAFFASPALAEPPYPTVDFQGDWVLGNQQGIEIKARMFFSAAERKMRIEMNQAGMAMTSIRDMDSGYMIMWSEQMPGVGMRLPKINQEDLEAVRTDETRQIGEETCTVWTVKQVETCLTEENIPIQTAAEGFSAKLEGLERVEQDPAMFEVPDGLNIMDMPTNMPGGGPRPGQGLPF